MVSDDGDVVIAFNGDSGIEMVDSFDAVALQVGVGFGDSGKGEVYVTLAGGFFDDPGVQPWLALGGAVLLVGLGLRYLVKPTLNRPVDESPTAASWAGFFAKGFLVNFVNPAGLFAAGSNLLRETEGSGAPVEGTPGEDGLGTLANNFLELSNVSVVDEMVNMIVGQRAYEANSKSVQTADTMLGIANGLKR